MDADQVASSIKYDIVSMVFGPQEKEPEDSLPLFTNSKLRTNMEDKNIVYSRGISRYPEVHHTTGAVAMYNNLAVFKLVTNKKLLNAVSEMYNVDQPNDKQLEIGLYHGPPAPLLKPKGSGVSAPFVYWFQDLSPGMKYTAVVALTNHDSSILSGNLEILTGFDQYFDLLEKYYDFSKHCVGKDVLFLDPKWFSLDDANRFITQYTNVYNYYSRKISPTGNLTIPQNVRTFYTKWHLEVPIKPSKLTWKEVNLVAGESYIFSSHEALRTTASKDEHTRTYLQIPLEPRPASWNEEQAMQMRESYETGRFGNWIKPGLRRYLRANNTELSYRNKYENKETKEERIEFVREHSKLFCI
uniref:Uncharacterized protein n=1 Tax=viral metagenome TaxID=1070528 RepID=A0A6C0CGK6_9ZZZZ